MYIDYFWQSDSEQCILNAIYTGELDENGNNIAKENYNIFPIAYKEGDVTFGVSGKFYTTVRTKELIELPAGCTPSDSFIVSNLLGVWA